jgi:hypothetical protein
LDCTEEIIYQKMIQWAEQQCRKEQHVTGNDGKRVTANDKQLRKVLGDLIYLIRFPIMQCKYFTEKGFYKERAYIGGKGGNIPVF